MNNRIPGKKNPHRKPGQAEMRARLNGYNHCKHYGLLNGGLSIHARKKPVVLTTRGQSCPYQTEDIPGLGITLTKTIKGSKHFLKKPPAIALDCAALDWAEREGITHIQVKDTESGIVYTTSLSHFREKGKQFNRGYGEQIFVPLNLWNTNGMEVK